MNRSLSDFKSAALFLTLVLALPTGVHAEPRRSALRQLNVGLEENPPLTRQLESRLNSALPRLTGLEEFAFEGLTKKLIGAWGQLVGPLKSGWMTVKALEQLAEAYNGADREGKIRIEETLWAASKEAAQELARRRLAEPPTPATERTVSQKTPVFSPMFIGYLDLAVQFRRSRRDDGSLVVDVPHLNLTAAGAQTNLLRVFNQLGSRVETVAALGTGPRSTLFLDLLRHERVEIPAEDWMRISGEDTGLNFFTFFREPGAEREDRLIAPAPAWTIQEQDRYLRQVDLKTGNMAGGIFILSMRPPFQAHQFMAGLLQTAKKNDMLTIYDPKPDVIKDAPLIESILRESPTLFKPNLQEFALLVHREESDLREDPQMIVQQARMLIAKFGIRMMLVSLDKDGALLIEKNRVVFARPPKIAIVSSVGAGDTGLAALVDRAARKGFSLDRLTDEQARELARAFVAGGTETTRRPGTELADIAGIQAMESRVWAQAYSDDRLSELSIIWHASDRIKTFSTTVKTALQPLYPNSAYRQTIRARAWKFAFLLLAPWDSSSWDPSVRLEDAQRELAQAESALDQNDFLTALKLLKAARNHLWDLKHFPASETTWIRQLALQGWLNPLISELKQIIRDLDVPRGSDIGPIAPASGGLEELNRAWQGVLDRPRAQGPRGIALIGPAALEGSEGMPPLWPLLIRAASYLTPAEKQAVVIYARNATLAEDLRMLGYSVGTDADSVNVALGFLPGTEVTYYTTSDEWLLRYRFPRVSATITLTRQNFPRELARLLLQLGYPEAVGLEQLPELLNESA